jgi:hypothetical protein
VANALNGGPDALPQALKHRCMAPFDRCLYDIKKNLLCQCRGKLEYRRIATLKVWHDHCHDISKLLDMIDEIQFRYRDDGILLTADNDIAADKMVFFRRAGPVRRRFMR